MAETQRPDEAVVEIAIPLRAEILRRRRRKPERVALLVSRPVRLARHAPGDAPVVASRITRQGSMGWAAPEEVRLAAGRHWRRLVPPGGGPPVRTGDLPGHVREWLGRNGNWVDAPFEAPRRGYGPIEVVDESVAELVTCSIDPDARHAAAWAALSRRLCLVGEFVHVACGEPVLDVTLDGLGSPHGGPSAVRVVPSASPRPDPVSEKEVAQTFRADAAREAAAFADALAAELGLRRGVDAGWEILAAPTRDDAAVGPGEGIRRIADRTHPLVGRLPRAAADAWLDLRDAGAAASPAIARGLRDALSAAAPLPGALALLLRIERLRWEGPDPGAAADQDALGMLA